MKQHVRLIALATLTASGPPAAAAPGLPVAATFEASGFATIREVPPSPFPDEPPASENRPRSSTSYYARMAGIGEAEARKRLIEQRAARPEFTRLLGILRAREAGNFTESRIVHRPNWAYVFYFKRDPQRTLARYTSNPHFQAAQGRHSQPELQAIAGPWAERFGRHRLLGGYGTDATFGEIRMDLVVSETEYRTIAEREGWRLPDAIKLAFAEPLAGPALEAGFAPLVRLFPQSDRALGPTQEALLGGRLELRDGCFYVTGRGQPDRLAYFARELALGLDGDGYLALRTRGPAPRLLGRIGEDFSWGGPIPAPETLPMVAELRERCGNAPLEHVGIPQSARLFRIRSWVIDAIAERRNIARDEAWRRFRACLEAQEAKRTAGYFDCDTL
jgi:hypothetical protein